MRLIKKMGVKRYLEGANNPTLKKIIRFIDFKGIWAFSE